MKLILHHRQLFLIAITTILFTHCKKKNVDEPIPNITNENVVFYFDGTISGNPVKWQAGIDNYYMFSDIQYETTLSTYLFIGEFKKNNCSPCLNTLKIKISDDTILNPSSPSHIYNLNVGTYNYLSSSDSSITQYTINVSAVPVFSATPAYQYSLNNTAISNIANFSYTLTPGTYTLTQDYYNITDSCGNSLSNVLNLTATDDFYAYYKYNINSFSQTVTYTIYTNMPTSNTFTFDFGDASQTTTTNTVLTHAYPPGFAIYQPELTAKSNNGKIWTFKNNISVALSNTDCLGNYFYNIVSQKNASPPFSKIIIEYTDQNGQTYTSQINTQPPTYKFQITKIEEYIKNSNNQPTKKITANFQARVFNTSNPSLFKDIQGNVIFAVAYK
ncbi:MAG: hypothetical protein Fur0023_18000 [Bacteroidia bacterium]